MTTCEIPKFKKPGGTGMSGRRQLIPGPAQHLQGPHTEGKAPMLLSPLMWLLRWYLGSQQQKYIPWPVCTRDKDCEVGLKK